MSEDIKSEFVPIENRDAWSTIRGYVYQVDQTILQWLVLPENEQIELERGEDYDVIKEAIEGKDAERELAQVKFREKNITLNSETSLESIVNFYTHSKNNPGHSIRFKFVTNTGYGTERPALFIDGKAGIASWIELFKSDSLNEEDVRITTLKRHLQEKFKEKFSDKEVNVYEEFYTDLNDVKFFMRLLKSFEWSIENSGNEQLADKIKIELIRIGMAADAEQANELYGRLFLYLFKLLSIKEIKVLTPASLKNEARLHALSEKDTALLAALTLMFSGIEQRVNKLEADMAIASEHISNLLTNATEFPKGEAKFDQATLELSTDIPSLVNSGTPREKKVELIHKLFADHIAIALQGMNGTGKTQLAALITQKYEHKWWLDLRSIDFDENRAAVLIESFLLLITNHNAKPQTHNWVGEVVRSMPADSLIIINDVPNVTPGSRLYNLLGKLIQALSVTTVKLLTTSNFDIEKGLKEVTTQDQIKTYTDLDFNDEEILEYLTNIGVSEIFYRYTNLIAIKSRRNPRLVSAIVYYLKSKEAAIPSEAVEAIVNDEITEEILASSQRSISSYIKDEDSKELLYRLSLIHWEYNFKFIQNVSKLEKEINHPKETLSNIIDLWIQAQGKVYLSSPLIHNLGKDNLSKQLVKNTYKAAAETILEDGKIDHITAGRAIDSYLYAEEFTEAGTVLITVYNSVKSFEEAKFTEQWGYLSYWKEVEIPEQMEIFGRVMIRTEQRRINQLLGHDYSYYVQELKRYFESADIVRVKLITATSILSSFDAKDNSFFTYFEFAMNNLDELAVPGYEKLDVTVFSSLIWSPIQFLFEKEDIVQWLRMIDIVEAKLNKDVLNEEPAQNVISVLKERILSKINEPDGIAHAKEKLEILKCYFDKKGNELLSSVVTFELFRLEHFYGEPNNVIPKAEKVYNQYSNNTAKYFFSASIGKLIHPGELSKKWLERAMHTDAFSQLTFPETLVYMASEVASDNPRLAKVFCLNALSLINGQNILETDNLPYLGEVAIACWVNEDYAESFEYFEQFVSRLEELKAENKIDELWYRCNALGGHTLAYISSMVNKKDVPQLGGQDFMKPTIGFLTVNTKSFADTYKSTNAPLLMVYLASFAFAVGDLTKAYYWSSRAFDLARTLKDPSMIRMVSIACSQYTLISFNIEAAFEQYLIDGLVAAYYKTVGMDRINYADTSTLEELQLNKPSEYWNSAESTTSSYAIVPMCIMVLTAILIGSSESVKMKERFLKMVTSYYPKASNKEYWFELKAVVNEIFDENIPVETMYAKANEFAENIDNKALQMLAILGIIYKTTNQALIVKEAINIMPYMLKYLVLSETVTSTVLVPFIKTIVISAINKEFIGSREELSIKISQVELVNERSPTAIQDLLQPAVEIVNLKVSEDRHDWLYSYAAP